MSVASQFKIIIINFIYNAHVPVLQKRAPSTVQLHKSVVLLLLLKLVCVRPQHCEDSDIVIGKSVETRSPSSSFVKIGAGIVQWLERRTRDR